MMSIFIANRIIQQADISLEAGQEKYRQYFTRTNLYLRYKAEVDVILTTDGYGECVVSA